MTFELIESQCAIAFYAIVYRLFKLTGGDICAAYKTASDSERVLHTFPMWYTPHAARMCLL